MIDSSDRQYGPMGTCDTYTLTNPYDFYNDDLIESLKSLSDAIMRLRWDENSRMYSIRNHPKQPKQRQCKPTRAMNRNNLKNKRLIKQSVRRM